MGEGFEDRVHAYSNHVKGLAETPFAINIYHYLKSGEKVLHLSKLYGKLFAQKSSSRINHYVKHNVVHLQNIGCAIFAWEDAPLINLEDERVGREIKMRKLEKFLWPAAFLSYDMPTNVVNHKGYKLNKQGEGTFKDGYITVTLLGALSPVTFGLNLVAPIKINEGTLSNLNSIIIGVQNCSLNREPDALKQYSIKAPKKFTVLSASLLIDFKLFADLGVDFSALLLCLFDNVHVSARDWVPGPMAYRQSNVFARVFCNDPDPMYV
ncbi:hypothetical protein LguiB_009782 [Lonicera macranthoides]